MRQDGGRQPSEPAVEDFPFALNIRHPDIMFALIWEIVNTGDVVQQTQDGGTVFQVTVPNWLVDELAALGADDEDAENDDPGE